MKAELGGSWSPAGDGLVLLMLAQVRENEQNTVSQLAQYSGRPQRAQMLSIGDKTEEAGSSITSRDNAAGGHG